MLKKIAIVVSVRPYITAAGRASWERMNLATTTVGYGRNATVIRKPMLTKRKTRSTRTMWRNSVWWLTQMIAIVTKLTTELAYEGHWFRRTWLRDCPPALGGTTKRITGSVIA